MATDFGSGVKTITASAAKLAASTKEVNWLTLKTLKSNHPIAIGATGVALTDGYLIFGNDPPLKLGTCDLADVFVIGTAGDKLFYVYGNTTAT